MKRQISLTPVIAVVVALALVAGYMLLIKPQRDSAKKLDEEIASLRTDLDIATAPPQPQDGGEAEVKIEFADLFRLAKAMPDAPNMAGIMLELDSIASSSGVEFLSITPLTPVPRGIFTSLPITLTFDGNYYDLTDFLYRVRNLVTVRSGRLDASGRLYTLDGIDMHESLDGFPRIEAELTVSAYVFGSAPAPTLPGQLPPPETADSTSEPPGDDGATPTDPAATEPAATEPAAPADGGADQAEALEGSP
jgi:Tfp pilus assembly protein PilO